MIKYYLNRHIPRMQHYWQEDKTLFWKHFIRLGFMTAKLPFDKVMKVLNDIEYKHKVGEEKEIQKLIQGSYMILPVEDKGLSKDLILNNSREDNAVRVFEKEFKGTLQVLDIGSNIGYYALMACKLNFHKYMELPNWERGHVYAIEPHPKAFKMLKQNMEKNVFDEKDVTLLNIGLSNKKEMRLYRSELGKRKW